METFLSQITGQTLGTKNVQDCMIITYNHIKKADGVMHPRHAITQRCRLLILGIQSNYKQHIDSMTLTVCTQLIKREMFYENKRKYIDQYGLLRFAHAKNQLLTKKEKEKTVLMCAAQTCVQYSAQAKPISHMELWEQGRWSK